MTPPQPRDPAFQTVPFKTLPLTHGAPPTRGKHRGRTSGAFGNGLRAGRSAARHAR